MAADDYAVIVGITSYPGLRTLQGPENDARVFREWAVSPAGGQVPDVDGVNIQMVCSSKYPAAATTPEARPWKADVYAALDKLRALGESKGGRTGRRLYLFFAGHGITPDNEVDEAALLMANAVKGGLSHVPGRKVVTYFRAAAYFDQVVLFMDCCRDAWGSTRLQSYDWDVLNRSGPVKHFSGFASQWNEKAREAAFELTKGKPEVHGVFTAHLITMLRGGSMTAAMLRGLMLNSAKRFAVPSTEYVPVFEPDAQTAIVLNEGAQPVQFPVSIRFNGLQPGEELEVRDGRFKTVYRDRPAGSEVAIPLPPTNYEARIRGTTREVVFDVPGQDSITL